jgi:hypothetical protein
MPCSLCPKIRALGCTIVGLLVLVGDMFRAPCVYLTIAAGDDKATLEREIDLVQTLLDEQPDSKCRCAVGYHLRLLTLFVMQGVWNHWSSINCYS